MGGQFQWSRGGANGFGKPNYFFDGLALHVQSHQERGNLSVRTLAAQDFGHYRMGFFARE
jgi:hypothetical protein